MATIQRWVRRLPRRIAFSYRGFGGEVLATERRSAEISADENHRALMSEPIGEPARIAKRNITWQMQLPLAACEHAFELIAHDGTSDLWKCQKCGNVETEWTPKRP